MSKIDQRQPPTQTGVRSALHDFFYATEVPYGMALIRIMLSIGLLLAMVPRWHRARELFSTDGAAAPLWESYGYPGLLPTPSAAIAIALCTLLIFALLMLSIGLLTRVSSVICLLLVPYLGLLDSLSTLTKGIVIAVHVLLLLSLSDCGAVWSVDAWIRRRQSGKYEPLTTLRSPVWTRRLIQLLLAVVYLSAAMTKMQTANFFSGDQLAYWLIGNAYFPNPLGKWLSLYSPLVVAMSFGALIWECSFAFVCWRGKGRAIALCIGLLFHMLTYFLLGLLVFPVLTLSTYFAFFNESEYRRFATRIRWTLRQCTRRLSIRQLTFPPAPQWLTPQVAMSLCGVAVCFAVVGGIEIERRRDLYGMRRESGPYELKPMARQEVARMMTNEGIRPIDSLMQFDVGIGDMAGCVALRQSDFRHGDEAVICCAAAPPHADMWVELNLHDEQNRLVKQMSTVLPREKSRIILRYPISEAYPPGQYDFVLRYEGKEVGRKRVTLYDSPTPRSASPTSTAISSAAPVQ